MIEDRLAEAGPKPLIVPLAGHFFIHGFQLGAEALMGFFPAGKAHYFQGWREFTVGGDIIKRRHQLAAGEVATGTKDNHRTGTGAVTRGLVFAEWIRRFQKNMGDRMNSRSGASRRRKEGRN